MFQPTHRGLHEEGGGQTGDGGGGVDYREGGGAAGWGLEGGRGCRGHLGGRVRLRAVLVVVVGG